MADKTPASASSTVASSPISSTTKTMVSLTLNSSLGHPLSTVLTVKLNDTNYLLWHGMVLAILRGQRVDGYVRGTNEKPQTYVEVCEEKGKSHAVPNPAYEEWVTVDRALSGWLFGSMDPTIAADVVNFETSQEVWTALEQMFGAASKARVNQLRVKLQNTKKGSMKMLDYLSSMKQTADLLQLAGAPVSISDLVSYVLGGLDAEYIPVICNIENKEFIMWQEVHAILVTFEGTLSRFHSSPALGPGLSDHSANYATNKQSYSSPQANSGGNQGGLGFNRGSQSQFSGRNERGRGRNNRGRSNGGRGNYQGQSSRYSNNNFSGSSPLFCPLCNKTGHDISICWYRFDETFNNPHNLTRPSTNNANSAVLATPEIINDPYWLADTGATTHVTADP